MNDQKAKSDAGKPKLSLVPITFEEFKEVLKKSIDETTSLNEALEKTVEFIYLRGYEDGNRRSWISPTISPKVSDKYLVIHGGTHLESLDFYTTMEDAIRIFGEDYEDYVGWQSKNVIAWMPRPLPESYKDGDEK